MGNILPESCMLRIEQIQEEGSQSFLTLLCLLRTVHATLGPAPLFWTGWPGV